MLPKTRKARAAHAKKVAAGEKLARVMADKRRRAAERLHHWSDTMEYPRFPEMNATACPTCGSTFSHNREVCSLVADIKWAREMKEKRGEE